MLCVDCQCPSACQPDTSLEILALPGKWVRLLCYRQLKPAEPLQGASSKAAAAADVQAGAEEQLAAFVALDDVDLEAVHLVNWEDQIHWAPGRPSRSSESTLTIGDLSCATEPSPGFLAA